jgi:hypothetical protein
LQPAIYNINLIQFKIAEKISAIFAIVDATGDNRATSAILLLLMMLQPPYINLLF